MEGKLRKYYLLNYVFLLSLCFLFINDHWFKYLFHNWFTGKLSDIAGMIILPLLLGYLFPRLKYWNLIISAILFSYWKSSYSQPLIDIYNQFSPIQTSRIIDYSDLIVLVCLPIPYWVIKYLPNCPWLKINKCVPIFVFIPAVFLLLATSPPVHYYYNNSNGNLRCYNCKISFPLNQEEIVNRLKAQHITFDTIAPLNSNSLKRLGIKEVQSIKTYKLNSWIIDKDTLSDLAFTMKSEHDQKTTIYFNGMNIEQDLDQPKLEIKLRKYYRRIVFSALKAKIDNKPYHK
jgi:hypothetical protein